MPRKLTDSSNRNTLNSRKWRARHRRVYNHRMKMKMRMRRKYETDKERNPRDIAILGGDPSL